MIEGVRPRQSCSVITKRAGDDWLCRPGIHTLPFYINPKLYFTHFTLWE